MNNFLIERFMKEQEEDFKFGRRHLANIMGKNPETFTQQDINVRKKRE